MIWDISEIESTQSNLKFGIKKDQVPISHHTFLNLLKDSEDFRTFYHTFLSEAEFDAFFWENKPMTQQTRHDRYECNLLKSDFLAGQSPDAQTFQAYFSQDKLVVCFPNLGNDARLIVPCPVNKPDTYTHIGNFVRNADHEQMHAFWKMVGEESLGQIGDEPKWLSTSGLGVFWLHVRIDAYPKYYQTKEYKTL